MFWKTKRLTLRDLRKEDFVQLSTDPSVMAFSTKGVMSRQQAESYFERLSQKMTADPRYGIWAIFEGETLIGGAALQIKIIDEEEIVDLGYRLRAPYRGQGYATEVALALCEYAFQTLNLTRVAAIIDPNNHPSLKVVHRMGMHYWKKTVFEGLPVSIYVLEKVVIVPFQSSWKGAFEEEKKVLNSLFHSLYHIGSTAISNCAAKPIIDILGVVSDITTVDSYTEKMVLYGYEALGEYGMRQRRFFRKKSSGVHLHIFEDTDPEVERHVRFCHYMERHAAKVTEYSRLKRDLAARFSHDRNIYTRGKNVFIKKIDIDAALEIKDQLPPVKEVKRKKKWSEKEIITAMEINMHLDSTLFGRYVPSLELCIDPDVYLVRSESAHDPFNEVYFAKFNEANLHHRVAYVQHHFKNTPFSWWVGPLDTPSGLEAWLLHEGLTLKEEYTGMYLYLDNVPTQKTPSSLRFQQVLSDETMKHFVDIVGATWGNLEIYQKNFFQMRSILYSNSVYELHVAYLNQEPVVTAILALHAGVAGIYYLATKTEQKRQGYGTAMVEYLLSRAKMRGFTIAILQASQQAKPLYQRLGFTPCCVFKELGSARAI